MLKNKKIVIGVSGGIAAYKSAELVRKLVNMSVEVKVIMTRSAQEFITPLTFQTLSGNKVNTGMFSLFEDASIEHIALANWADIFVVAPATANIIGKISNGIADDSLSTTIMATKVPILIAPAMNTNMYENRIVQENIKDLKSMGYHLIGPDSGDLACGTQGPGRLADIEYVIEEIDSILTKKDLLGENVLVTAGPTLEPADPIRFITNRSTGKMGYAVAKVANKRGAKVTLVSGPSILPVPSNIKFISVETAQEMEEAVFDNFEESTIVIKTAAVSDYKFKNIHSKKLKRNKSELIFEMEETTDILSELGKKKGEKIIVGFAAETEELISNAKEKLTKKNLDLIIANDVSIEGAGFKYDTNIVKILDSQGRIKGLPLMSKTEVAQKIFDRVRRIKDQKKRLKTTATIQDSGLEKTSFNDLFSHEG
ncbi:MAG: bifunctional phosphopantothenoylcysteine decarboxylase/phosphopantothenate--cysteine ligase CoaBC [Thermodesulfobacteriota bacterium]|nr:bifunctional phosphopantothenoylcysteine decarboxylase/phosphopantothenate--cysteine ligase CoaBC [Thermodesulfobacteriota bacterium]